MEQVIKSFCISHDGIRHKTTQWENKRKHCIGGSDYSAVIGQDYFNSYNKKLTEKTSNEGGHTSVACLWGQVFEEVAIAVIESRYNTNVYGNNIYIHHGGEDTAYSPDGFCVLPVQSDGDLLCPPGDPSQEEIALLEIKCPYTRIPGRIIPPQILLGLHHSPPATIGVFVDCVFRVCAYEDLGRAGAYNLEYHHKNRKKYKETVAWGYTTIKDIDDEGDYASNGKFDTIFDYDLDHHGPWMGRPTNIPERPAGAFFCWKLFTMRVTTIRPDPAFIEKNKLKVSQFMEDLERVKKGTYSDGRRYFSLADLYID